MTKRLMTLEQARSRGLTTLDPKPFSHKQIFTFPWPPSINMLYRTDRETTKRHLPQRGLDFIKAVMDQLLVFGAKPYYGARVAVGPAERFRGRYHRGCKIWIDFGSCKCLTFDKFIRRLVLISACV